MTVAVILLALAVFILGVVVKIINFSLTYRLNEQLEIIRLTQNDIINVKDSLSKSEEKRKKMGDAFFHDLNILKERHDNLVELVVRIRGIEQDIDDSLYNEIKKLEKSIETTDEMLLELATKVEYLENK